MLTSSKINHHGVMDTRTLAADTALRTGLRRARVCAPISDYHTADGFASRGCIVTPSFNSSCTNGPSPPASTLAVLNLIPRPVGL